MGLSSVIVLFIGYKMVQQWKQMYFGLLAWNWKFKIKLCC